MSKNTRTVSQYSTLYEVVLCPMIKLFFDSNDQSNKSHLESMLEDLTNANPVTEVLEHSEKCTKRRHKYI